MYYSYRFAPTEMTEGTLPINQHVSIVYFIAVPDPGREVFSTLCDVPEWRWRRVDVINVTILTLQTTSSILEPVFHCVLSRTRRSVLQQTTMYVYFTVANLVKYTQTHTEFMEVIYNSQIKLYEITGTVEHKNKSAHTEMSRAHLDFRLIVDSTRHATEGTYTNKNNNIWVNNQRVMFTTSIECTKYKTDLICIIDI